ncbi:beta,beta-carotene 15,15'-dioxygenase [Trichonephila clavata]|uniref:Beta,beta-carotene 15,15'-dioxygenase n=1 Tax=Trichonephila clavata TaxID=2740835 RepID=A0A8X6FW09_TRICU|nr:beta,beta-carotene 15,15'-dioxygenase [Trichonephila clavata]
MSMAFVLSVTSKGYSLWTGLSKVPLPVFNFTSLEGKQGTNLVTLKDTTAVAIKQDEHEMLLIPETKGKVGYELPTINYSMFNSKKYRYVYGSSIFSQEELANSLIKLDNVTEEMKVWNEGSTMYPSEITYIPRPGSTLEDDGVLLSVVKDIEENARDFLLVLDAKTFKVLAKAFVPRSVQLPTSMHGKFQRI